jgi:hypothetical protein
MGEKTGLGQTLCGGNVRNEAVAERAGICFVEAERERLLTVLSGLDRGL